MCFQNEKEEPGAVAPEKVAPLTGAQLRALLQYIDARIAEVGSGGGARSTTRVRLRAEGVLYSEFQL